MQELINYLFGAAAFVPHGYCLLWRPDLVALHAVSDAVVAVAYFSIPAALLVFVRGRRDLAYKPVFGLFAAFITACGITHVVDLTTLWIPLYGLQGVLKAITAAVSLATAVAVWYLIPEALALPGPAELAAANASLELEVGHRRSVEAELRAVNQDLEQRVRERMAEIADANRALVVEARERERAEADLRRSVAELEFLLRTREDLERRIADRSHELESANALLADEVEERRRVEVELRASVGRLESYMTNTPLGVVEWRVRADGAWVVERWTGQTESILDWPANDTLGRTAREIGLLADDEFDRAAATDRAVLADGRLHSRVTLRCRSRSGETRVCSWYNSYLQGGEGEPIRVLSLVEDVTDRVVALERAEWLASHDPLTGLPNRMLFQDRLAHGVARARRQEERLAVMMIDVDRFKAVNDLFGHPAGDSLLKELADRLSTAVRETDTLARLGVMSSP